MGKQVAAGFAKTARKLAFIYNISRFVKQIVNSYEPIAEGNFKWRVSESPPSAAIIRGFSKLSFLMVERPDSNLKTSYSRDNDFKIILNIKTSEIFRDF